MKKLNSEELLSKYGIKVLHSQEVNRLAMMIFDETCKTLYPLTPREREYLRAAALLHDIGYFISAEKHNKHTLKMIQDEGIEGFNSRELKIIGCICRYHRGSLPDKTKHEIYKDLEKKERKMVKRLGGILKLADGLVRGDKHQIKNIKLEYDAVDNIVKFILYPLEGGLPDINCALRKRDLFELGFKCQSVIVFSHE